MKGIQKIHDARKAANKAREKAIKAKEDAVQVVYDYINETAQNLPRNPCWSLTDGCIRAGTGGLRWNISGNAYRLNPFDWDDPRHKELHNVLLDRIGAGTSAADAIRECHRLDTKLYDLMPASERHRLFTIDWSKVNKNN